MTGLLMPAPDAETLLRRNEIVAALRTIVPGEGVVDAVTEMRAFETDGLTAYRQLPLVVVLPQTVSQVSRILAYCNERNIRVVPRGSGTSLSGGALPLEDGVLLVMSRFNRILEIDYPNRAVVAQPGVTNLGITNAVEQEGFYYAPDPSSQIACSIGGNVAENSGGVHCLKYGLTANNVLGIEMVLMNGEVIRLGGKHLDSEGYDLLGVMTGSEGLLGVVTEVTVRILKKPETARALLIGFPTSEQGGQCVADIIGAGIIPGGMEMMDRPAIHAAEDFVHAGYPLDVEALLIVELDGPPAEVDHLIGAVEAIALANGSTTCRVSDVGGGAPVLLGRAQGGVSWPCPGARYLGPLGAGPCDWHRGRARHRLGHRRPGASGRGGPGPRTTGPLTPARPRPVGRRAQGIRWGARRRVLRIFSARRLSRRTSDGLPGTNARESGSRPSRSATNRPSSRRLRAWGPATWTTPLTSDTRSSSSEAARSVTWTGQRMLPVKKRAGLTGGERVHQALGRRPAVMSDDDRRTHDDGRRIDRPDGGLGGRLGRAVRRDRAGRLILVVRRRTASEHHVIETNTNRASARRPRYWRLRRPSSPSRPG